MKGKNEDVKLLLEKVLKSGDFSSLHVECLTDTWIGKDRSNLSLFIDILKLRHICFFIFVNVVVLCTRWAFVDLNAGPFSWGPAVGGEGVRTEASLPDVEKTIGAVSGSHSFLFDNDS